MEYWTFPPTQIQLTRIVFQFVVLDFEASSTISFIPRTSFIFASMELCLWRFPDKAANLLSLWLVDSLIKTVRQAQYELRQPLNISHPCLKHRGTELQHIEYSTEIEIAVSGQRGDYVHTILIKLSLYSNSICHSWWFGCR